MIAFIEYANGQVILGNTNLMLLDRINNMARCMTVGRNFTVVVENDEINDGTFTVAYSGDLVAATKFMTRFKLSDHGDIEP